MPVIISQAPCAHETHAPHAFMHPMHPVHPCRRFKELAEKKKGITDEDVLALMSDELHQPKTVWELLDLQVGQGMRLAVKL